MIQVKIKLNGGIMPVKATKGAAAYDLYVPEDVEIKGGRQVISLGFSMELPHGYAATIQPRSGFSARGMAIDVCGYATTIDADVIRGLIDEDYRGNVGVIINTRDRIHYPPVIRKGTRIAQMQIVEVPQIDLVEVNALSETSRGDGGFGHTGVNKI